MIYQDELLEAEVVSVWAGNLESEDALTEYLGQPFEADFGFLLDPDDLPEAAIGLPDAKPRLRCSNAALQPADVRELLGAIEFSPDWAAAAERACRQQGLGLVRALVAFPYLNYRAELGRNPEAPLRFIGTFKWPSGREGWRERVDAQLICPPFPKLRRRAFGGGELYAWDGRVHLESWKGFAKREELADEFMTFRFSAPPEGDLALDVRPPDIEHSSFQPTAAQARAFQHLLDNQQAVLQSVLEGIFSTYDGWRENYYGEKISSDGGKTWQAGWELPELFPPENMPKLASAGELVRLIAPATVYVLANEIDGYVRIGFGFDCKWEEEHGLGVLTHNGRVIEVGQSDTAFTDA